MRAPPAVGIVLRSRLGWRTAVALAHAAAACAVVAWADGRWPGVVNWPAAALVAASVLASGWGWRISAASPMRLRWTGSVWRLDAPGAAALAVDRLDVMVDAGPWMLLRTPAGPGRSRWFTASSADAEGQWRAFRAAVYCPALSSLPRSPSERAPH